MSAIASVILAFWWWWDLGVWRGWCWLLGQAFGVDGRWRERWCEVGASWRLAAACMMVAFGCGYAGLQYNMMVVIFNSFYRTNQTSPSHTSTRFGSTSFLNRRFHGVAYPFIHLSSFIYPSLLYLQMVRMSVLADCLKTITNAEKRGKRQVLIRPSSKVIVKFLQCMQQHGKLQLSDCTCWCRVGVCGT